MKKLTKTELKRILKEHKKWVKTFHKEGCRADLSGVDLHQADLGNAQLYGAILCDANLNGADLSGAVLSDAKLEGASLFGADLSKANLAHADLTDAVLFGACLVNSNFKGADLKGADLRYADLTGANVNYPIACPEKGSFIGYKKIKTYIYHGWVPILACAYIIELEIPAEAKRCSATSRKCRCQYAKVLSITNIDGTKVDVKSIVNDGYASPCTYTVGEYVYPDSFDEDRWNECSHGIHFFITRQEAVDY